MQQGKSPFSSNPEAQGERMQRYYRQQARVYDWTRWAFLFGRAAVLRHVPALPPHARIVEVGCGTGRNLLDLGRRFPEAHLTGIDVSPDMIAVARHRMDRAQRPVEWIAQPYTAGVLGEPVDLILFSYSLTMINPQWEDLIQQAKADLRPGGFIAVVDFHDTRSGLLRGHMDRHHVRMDAHLLPVLARMFEPVHQRVGRAYLGWWTWFAFVGRKSD